jgi:hypothetical protein
MTACLEKMEATNLEANPEAVYREVPKEVAAVEIGRAPNKRQRGRRLAEKRHDQPKERKLWIPEEINRCPQNNDPPCRSGTAQGKRRREKSDQGQRGTRNLEKTDVREEASA